MERPTKNVVEPQPWFPRPVSEKQLLAILESLKGSRTLMLRLAVALRDERLITADLKQRLADIERDWSRRERVLVVSEPDGAVEVFGPSWISVKHVPVKPWEDRDEVVQALSAKWKSLDSAPLSKVLIVPQVRAELTEESLVNLATWHDRVTAFDRLLELRQCR